MEYDGKKTENKELVEKILASLVLNQQNRSQLAQQLSNKVFSNEWWIMLVLFSITLSFVLQLNVGDSVMIHIVQALLCTGLSMLMINLVKLSTLSHKKARELMGPAGHPHHLTLPPYRLNTLNQVRAGGVSSM